VREATSAGPSPRSETPHTCLHDGVRWQNSVFRPSIGTDRPFRMRFLFLFLVTVIWTLPAAGQMQVTGYTHQQLGGWDIYVSNEATATSQALTEQALSILADDLDDIKQLGLPGEAETALLAVPIFVDWAVTTGAAVYHPSEAWLSQNGYPTEKVKAVEISNVTNFINWTSQNQPMMVLHELAHAFHDRILGFDDTTIWTAYDSAMNASLYTPGQYDPGDGQPFSVANAYATNNRIEYFGEITEAYFGRNDYYPFVRQELESHDPTGFAAVESSWNVGAATAVETSPVVARAEPPYPNPASGIVHLPSGGRVSVYDGMGREVATGEGMVDLTGLAQGVYFVRSDGRVWPLVKR
jgi:hypothetical protein